MATLGNILLALFIACWCIAMGTWIYSARFHYPVAFHWVRDEPRKSEYSSKARRGIAVFIAAWFGGAMVGLAASWLGAWR